MAGEGRLLGKYADKMCLGSVDTDTSVAATTLDAVMLQFRITHCAFVVQEHQHVPLDKLQDAMVSHPGWNATSLRCVQRYRATHKRIYCCRCCCCLTEVGVESTRPGGRNGQWVEVAAAPPRACLDNIYASSPQGSGCFVLFIPFTLISSIPHVVVEVRLLPG